MAKMRKRLNKVNHPTVDVKNTIIDYYYHYLLLLKGWQINEKTLLKTLFYALSYFLLVISLILFHVALHICTN